MIKICGFQNLWYFYLYSVYIYNSSFLINMVRPWRIKFFEISICVLTIRVVIARVHSLFCIINQLFRILYISYNWTKKWFLAFSLHSWKMCRDLSWKYLYFSMYKTEIEGTGFFTLIFRKIIIIQTPFALPTSDHSKGMHIYTSVLFQIRSQDNPMSVNGWFDLLARDRTNLISQLIHTGQICTYHLPEAEAKAVCCLCSTVSIPFL